MATWVVVIAAALVFPDPVADGIAAAAVVVLVLYCFARPQGGLFVFLAAGMPSAGARLLEDVMGAPRAVFFVLLPLSLWLIWEEDKKAAPAGGGTVAHRS